MAKLHAENAGRAGAAAAHAWYVAKEARKQVTQVGTSAMVPIRFMTLNRGDGRFECNQPYHSMD